MAPISTGDGCRGADRAYPRKLDTSWLSSLGLLPPRYRRVERRLGLRVGLAPASAPPRSCSPTDSGPSWASPAASFPTAARRSITFVAPPLRAGEVGEIWKTTTRPPGAPPIGWRSLTVSTRTNEDPHGRLRSPPADDRKAAADGRDSREQRCQRHSLRFGLP